MADEQHKPDTDAREASIVGQPPRIRPLAEQELTPEARHMIEAMSGLSGQPSSRAEPEPEVTEMLRIMARHPQLYEAHLAAARIFFRGELAPRDRELAILRVGWLCQAPFEWGEHVEIAKRTGITAQEIERVTQGSATPGWSDHDRAILRAVEELRDDAMISDETWATLDAGLDDKQLIELVMLVGQYETVAYYQNSLRLPPRKRNRGLSAR